MSPDALAWINAGSRVLGAALGGPTTSSATSSAFVDGSGWAVNTAESGAANASAVKTPLPSWPVMLGLLAAATVAVVIWKRK